MGEGKNSELEFVIDPSLPRATQDNSKCD